MQAWFFALLINASCAVHAADNEAVLAFTDRVVEVINSKDFAQRRALAHHTSLPCLNGEARDLIEEQFLEQIRPPVPSSYKAAVRAVSSGQRIPAPDGFEFAVGPTHRVEISFPDGYLIRLIHLWMVHDGAQWREVWACPNSEKLRQIRANQARFDSDCSAAPPDAVLELPAPMQEWLSVRCLSVGHGLRPTESAVWVHIGTQERLGAFPAQCKGPVEKNRHGHYFTEFRSVELEESRTTPEEHRQRLFSNAEVQVWKLSASTNNGTTILFYFATGRDDMTRMRVAVGYGPDCEFTWERYFVRLW